MRAASVGMAIQENNNGSTLRQRTTPQKSISTPNFGKKKSAADMPSCGAFLFERFSFWDRKQDETAKKKCDNDIELYRSKLASDLEQNIGMLKSPVTTFMLFLQYAGEVAAFGVKRVLTSRLTWFCVVPAIVSWIAAKFIWPDGFNPPVCGETEGGALWKVEMMTMEVLWWAILGILSSVGFGTGLHSGVMFLFPHVMEVVTAGEACRTTNGLVPWYQHPCYLDCSTTYGPKDDSSVNFWRFWALVAPSCIIWGVGTAMGELPPYLVSKAARLAGSKDTEFESELEEARGRTDVLSRMKIWTIDFTEKHGFIGVFLLASWPNAAFDMCGMCCGYVLMPFWTFLIATILGKGFVKVNGQGAFFINLFGRDAFQVMLSALGNFDEWIKSILGKTFGLAKLVEKKRGELILSFKMQTRIKPAELFAKKSSGSLGMADIQAFYKNGADPAAADGASKVIAQRVLTEWDANKNGQLSLEEVGKAVSKTDKKLSLGSLDPGKPTSIFKVAFELFIFALILYFVVSIVDQCAKAKQQELDEKKVQAKIEKMSLKKSHSEAAIGG